MRDPEITVEPDGPNSGVLRWQPAQLDDPDSLTGAILAAAADAFADPDLRRIEADVAADDHLARRALLRSGFRWEGTRRRALLDADGQPVDQLIFARLDDDRIDGPDGFSGVMNSTLPRKRLIAHVLTFAAHRRTLVALALDSAGVGHLGWGDPMRWVAEPRP